MLKAGIVGLPNVGKSTLINNLAGKKVAKTGNMPGVTRNNVWLKTKYKVLVTSADARGNVETIL